MTATSEALLPTRVEAWMAGVFGLVALGLMVSALSQLVAAYMSGEGIDVSPQSYVVISAFYGLTMYLAAYQLRKLARFGGFWLSLRFGTVMAQYDSPCSPAVAGALVDGSFDLAEVKAMMIDLYYRGYLQREFDGMEELWSYQVGGNVDLQPSEIAFMEELFAYEEIVRLPRMMDRVEAAGRAAHEWLYREAVQAGLVRDPNLFEDVVAAVSNALMPVGYGVVSLMGLGFILDPQAVLTIGYPRYPLSAWEILLMVLPSVLVIVTLGLVFWRSFLTAKGREAQARFAGFYLYIRKVYRDPRRYLAESDMKKFFPYAVAFRLRIEPEGPAQEWGSFLSL